MRSSMPSAASRGTTFPASRAHNASPFLHRLDYTGRLLIKND
jgi:hypothetical protein